MVLYVQTGVSPMSLVVSMTVQAHTSPNISGANATSMLPLIPTTLIPHTGVSSTWITDLLSHRAALTHRWCIRTNTEYT
jgi:hypothetical protein